ncbi:hypothetical protein HUJ05_003658 [Dendroctonus ponderosae]|nr:hypothetical protein HUJ05_003658 [Dendroctonus ponderosae]
MILVNAFRILPIMHCLLQSLVYKYVGRFPELQFWKLCSGLHNFKTQIPSDEQLRWKLRTFEYYLEEYATTLDMKTMARVYL